MYLFKSLSDTLKELKDFFSMRDKNFLILLYDSQDIGWRLLNYNFTDDIIEFFHHGSLTPVCTIDRDSLLAINTHSDFSPFALWIISNIERKVFHSPIMSIANLHLMFRGTLSNPEGPSGS